MMSEGAIITALAEVLTAPARHPAFFNLSRPLYPRELRVYQTGTSFVVEVDKYGFSRYKRNRRYKSPNPPPTVDTKAIQTALNVLLPDSIFVAAVTDNGTFIKIFIKEETLHENFI